MRYTRWQSWTGGSDRIGIFDYYGWWFETDREDASDAAVFAECFPAQ